MSGVYGNFLLAFPEQFRSVVLYEMTAKINGGWEKVSNSEITINAIFQHTSAGNIKDSNGNLVESSGLELWTETKDLNGMFTTLENKVYRLVTFNDWTHEGGFVRYTLEKVVGNNGSESENTSWNIGTDNFS